MVHLMYRPYSSSSVLPNTSIILQCVNIGAVHDPLGWSCGSDSPCGAPAMLLEITAALLVAGASKSW
jgi:hypothetical protein